MFENTQKKHFPSLSAKNFILKNYHKFSFKSCSKHKLNVLRCIEYMLVGALFFNQCRHLKLNCAFTTTGKVQ